MTSDKNSLGVAFDVGTTTLVGALVQGPSGEVLDRKSLPNPLSKWGLDVLSRVRAITKEPALLATMQSALSGALDEIVSSFAPDSEIISFSAAGNSVMEHLLLRVSPEPLGVVPYRPVFKEAKNLVASEIGIESAPGAALYTFPLVGGFIGGDTVAVMLSLGLENTSKTTVAVDIGTNSEIVLKTPGGGGRIYSASAAAGPAFEGGQLSSGMTARRGAVERVTVRNGEVTLDVIEGVAPLGICGSGLVSAASEFLRAGLIEPSGRIKPPEEIEDNLSSKVIADGDGGNSIVLYRGQGGAVKLTQEDVRSLQTAKGAIRAGISVLLDKAGVAPEDVDEIFIAGAFGSNLDKEALFGIGLFDPLWQKRSIRTVGDAALDGAVKALFSEEARAEAARLAKETKYVSLSANPGFEREFINNMSFGV